MMFRLIDTFDNVIVTAPSRASCVMLSYVWGLAQQEKHQLGKSVTGKFDRQSLPAALLDPLDLRQAIVQRYIWIDQLCIDWSQPDEVATTIAAMGRIYGSSCLTIIAASGTSVNAGLACFRKPCESAHLLRPIEVSIQGMPVMFAHEFPDLSKVWQTSAWGSRGWAYQERVMSPTYAVFA